MVFWQASSLQIESRKVDLNLPYFFYCFEAKYIESTRDLKVDVDNCDVSQICNFEVLVMCYRGANKFLVEKLLLYRMKIQSLL